MAAVVCPSCEESERLVGDRRPDGTVAIRCEACGMVWERDSAPRCRLCGSDDLERTAKPLWEKGRGDQHTPAGRIYTYHCHACGARDATSRNPLPGPPDHTAPKFATDRPTRDADRSW